MKRKPKMTPKQRVLKKYRRATVGTIRRYSNPVTVHIVYKGPHQPGWEVGEGATPRQAWANAARSLP